MLVFYDFEKLTSYLLLINQNFLLFAGKCRADRILSNSGVVRFIPPPSSLTRNPVNCTYILVYLHTGRNCFQASVEEKTSWWTIDLLNIYQIVIVNATFADDEPIPSR